MCRRYIAAAALAALTLALTSTPATAAKRPRAMSVEAFATLFCTDMFEIQVAALESYDGLAAQVAAPPDDAIGAKAQRTALVTQLMTASKKISALAHDLSRAGDPRFPRGEEIVGQVIDVSEQGAAKIAALGASTRTIPTARVSTFTSKLQKVDSNLVKQLKQLGEGYDKLRRIDPHRTVRTAFDTEPKCGTLGGRLGAESSASSATPVPATTAIPSPPSVPTGGDASLPPLLLPGGTAPSPDATTVASQTTMNARARLLFYGGHPVVDAGQTFSSHCPKPESAAAFILGCYIKATGDIYLYKVTRPELAGVVDVTGAHEMLHAAYTRLSDSDRTAVDQMTAAYFASTTNEHLRAQIADYDKIEPTQRANELHSLIGAEMGQLPPELETYYGRYFRDRQAVVGQYAAYVAVFDGIKRQRDDLGAQLADLKGTLSGLEAQINAAGANASSLSGQITALRAQGRIAESNNLVGPQNAAVAEQRSLIGQYNALVSQYNDLVAQFNALTVTGNDLLSSLRPTA